nr:FGGY-family carbohydrate kinase [Candidatus Microthrix sp.]
MEADSGVTLHELRVGGGMVKNELLMQFQADILGIPHHQAVADRDHGDRCRVQRGSPSGFWPSTGGAAGQVGRGQGAGCPDGRATRERELAQWKKAVTRTFDWVDAEPV